MCSFIEHIFNGILYINWLDWVFLTFPFQVIASWHTVHYEYLEVFAYLFLSFYVFRFLLHLLGMNVFNVCHQYH